MSDDYNHGKDAFRDDIVNYLRILAECVDEKDAEDLPSFLRVLAKRIDNFEVP